MATTITFTGSGFSVVGVSQLTPDSVKLTFSQPPLVVNPSGVNDALNVTNYSISGPAINSILGISSFTSDSILITFASGLVAGNWTLIVSNVHSTAAAMIVPNPTVVNFISSGVFVPEPLGGGALNTSAEDIIKKHSGIFNGKTNWEALWAALATGDQLVFDTADAAFEQLFLSTAQGRFLEDRIADEGYFFPQGLGLDREVFRSLILDIKANKLTIGAFLKVLNAFYGDKKTRAFITSTNSQPFQLTEGDILSIDIDGRIFNIEFENNDFSNIANCTSQEICNKLNSEFSKVGLTARAVPFTDASGDTFIEVFSGAIGLSGYVRVIGGSAQKVLNFPSLVNTTQATGTTWQISKLSPTKTKILYSSGTNPTVNLLSVGDYVLLSGSNINQANRGSFEIKEVFSDYFTIENVFTVPQTFSQVAADDLLFFRPTKYTVNSVLNPAIATQLDNQAEIILPVNIDVERSFIDGGYLGGDPDYVRQYTFPTETKIQYTGAISRTANVWTINTSIAHGLIAGDVVFIERPRLDIVHTNVTEGVLTITGAPSATSITATGIDGANFSETISIGGQYLYKKFKAPNGDIYLNSPSATANLSAGDTVFLENVVADYPITNPETFTKLFSDNVSLASGFAISEEIDQNLQKNSFVYWATPNGISDSFLKIDLKNESVSTLASLPVAGFGVKDGAMARVVGSDKIFYYLNNVSSYLYDISQNIHVPTSISPAVRASVPYVVALPNGKIFIWGRDTTVGMLEVFDSITGYWRAKIIPFRCDIDFTKPCANDDGVVFVSSGQTSAVLPNTQYWLYDSEKNSTIGVAYPWASHRERHDVFYHKKLGKFVVSGGIDTLTSLPVSAQGIYTFDPVTREWEEIISGQFQLWEHNGWELDKDRAVFVGGYTRSGGFPVINDKIFVVNLKTKQIEEEKTINSGLMGSLSLTSIYNNGKYLLVDINNSGLLFSHSRKKSFSANFPKILKYSSKTGNTLKFEPVFRNSLISETACGIKTSITDSFGIESFPTITLFKDSGSALLSGSYLSDSRAFEFTSKTATLDQDIDPQTAYSTLLFADTSILPNSGYIILGLGTEYQTLPIKYIQKISSTELQLENFISDKFIPSGLTANFATGTLLDVVSKNPFYLTNPPELRIFAERMIDSIKAAGSNLLINVKYPESWGLGNSQIPIDSTGPKISEAIYIWGNEQDYLRRK